MLMQSPMERAFDMIKDDLGPWLEGHLRKIAVKEAAGLHWLEHYNSRRTSKQPRPRQRIEPDGSGAKWSPDGVLTLIDDEWAATGNFFEDARTEKDQNAVRADVKTLLAVRSQWAHRDDNLTSVGIEAFLHAATRVFAAAGLHATAQKCSGLFPVLQSPKGEELEALPIEDRNSLPVAKHLVRLGVPRFNQFSGFDFHPDASAIEDYIELYQLAGEDGRGLSGNLIKVERDPHRPTLPNYVWEKLKETRPPSKNNPMAFVTACHAPVIDQGRTLDLRLADGDWHLRESIHACKRRILRGIEKRSFDLREFPGYLTVSVTVECTPDAKFILCRRVPKLAVNARQWSIGIGEIMHRIKDCSDDRGLHPDNTITRGLQEELGLSAQVDFDVRYFAIALSIGNFSTTLFAHASLNMPSWQLREIAQVQAGEHEWDTLDAVNCGLAECVDLVVKGRWAAERGSADQLSIAAWSRLGVLYFALRRFGLAEVRAALAARDRNATRMA